MTSREMDLQDGQIAEYSAREANMSDTIVRDSFKAGFETAKMADREEIASLREINARLLDALKAVVRDYVGERHSGNVYGPSGISADMAKAAIRAASGTPGVTTEGEK